MSNYQKKVTVTLRPEWEPMLQQLKQERFYNGTRAEMLRYILGRGLDSAKAKHTEQPGNGWEST